jgi:hypothetical protein
MVVPRRSLVDVYIAFIISIPRPHSFSHVFGSSSDDAQHLIEHLKCLKLRLAQNVELLCTTMR